MFVLTENRSHYGEDIGKLHSKMVILNKKNLICLDELSISLKAAKIEKLYVFSIDNNVKESSINITTSENGAKVNYLEMNPEIMVKFREQLLNYWPPGVRDLPREEYLNNEIRSSQTKMVESFNKVNQLKAAIKEIEPNFNSDLNYTNNGYSCFRAGRG